jgi:hypothetical protein
MINSYQEIDLTYRGHDDRQPPQDTFRAKSPEYMAAFRRYAEMPNNDNLCRLMSFSKTQRVHCPRCKARMTDGQCWQGCFNKAALESQRQVNAAICAQYDHEPTCGNYTEDEVADMRHPMF